MKKMKTIALGALLLLTGVDQLIAQETQVKFFGQPEFQSQKITKKGSYFPNPPSPYPAWKDSTYTDSTKSAFSTGNFVLFVTSQLTDRISVLSENTAKVVNGVASFEVQRLMLRYYIKDYFSLRVGKMFNPIGYWSNQYNMGLVLQPTIQRSSIIRPANEGGINQVNNVGFQVEGDNISKARIFYRLFLCNGSGAKTLSSNVKNQYAFTGAIGAEPVEGLKVLASAHYDVYGGGRANNAGVVLKKSSSYVLSNFSIAYMNPEKKAEFVAEYFHQATQIDSIGGASSFGAFVYAGYKITNKLIPYVQYTYSQAGGKASTDYYYLGENNNGINVKVQDIVLGVRYKFTSNFVVKFEYNFLQTDIIYKDKSFALQNALLPGYTSGDKVGRTVSQGPRMQFAFAF
jgi:hypothetical protein